jgi:DNA-binding CsgD family transcriptional regulator
VTILVTGTDPCFATLETDQLVRSGISADLLAALDLLNLGILVIDCEGGITFANRAAKNLLQDRSGQKKSESAAVFDRIRTATLRRETAEHCFTLPTKDRKSLIVLIARPNDAGAGTASSVVFIDDPMAQPELDLRPITHLYGLTRAEARLLDALVRGERIGTYASKAGITLNTAKGYLKQLFGKTRTRRQSDLLRLVLGSPLLRLVSAKSGTDAPK